MRFWSSILNVIGARSKETTGKILWVGKNASSVKLREHLFLIKRFLFWSNDEPERSLLNDLQFMANSNKNSGRAGVLFGILEANLLVRVGNPTLAAKKYETLIRREEIRWREIKGLGPAGLRALEHQRLILAILFSSLAECHSNNEAISEKQIEEEYQKAVSYGPDLTWIRTDLSEHYIKYNRWDDAVATIRERYLAKGVDADFKQLNADLAQFYLTKATELKKLPKSVTAPKENNGGSVGNSDKGNPLDSSHYKLEAVEVLKKALTDLDWTDNMGWKGKLYFEKGAILEDLSRPDEAISDYEQSAVSYEKSGDFSSATYVRMVRGDLTAKTALMDSLLIYEAVYKAIDQITDERQRERRTKDLLSRLALVGLSKEGSEITNGWLEKRMKLRVESTWGYYYDILSDVGDLMRIPALRNLTNALYSRLLGDTVSDVEARDLTASSFLLYDFEQKYSEEKLNEFDLIDDASRIPELLNVHTPIAIELDEELFNRLKIDQAIMDKFGNDLRSRIQNKFGVYVPGVRFRTSSSELNINEFALMIHEVVLVKDFCVEESIEPILARLADLIEINLVEFVGHQEVQNLLERNELVTPTVEGIAAKEYYKHMDPLTIVIRALVLEQVPIIAFRPIYEAFSQGQSNRHSLTEIINTIRVLPQIRGYLWGNDGSYKHVLISPQLESFFESFVQAHGQYQILVVKKSVEDALLTSIDIQLQVISRPVVIVRKEINRALLRQFIAIKLPHVPVLSIREVRPTTAQIEILDVDPLKLSINGNN
jgi:tetratricopeptide (TPR) repeat protein